MSHLHRCTLVTNAAPVALPTIQPRSCAATITNKNFLLHEASLTAKKARTIRDDLKITGRRKSDFKRTSVHSVLQKSEDDFNGCAALISSLRTAQIQREIHSTSQLQLPESGLPSRRSPRSRRKKSWCGNRGVFKRAQKRTAQIRQTVDGCERFIFAIAQCRIDQTSSSHEPHLPISLSIPDSEKAMPLLVSRDQEFMYVR